MKLIFLIFIIQFSSFAFADQVIRFFSSVDEARLATSDQLRRAIIGNTIVYKLAASNSRPVTSFAFSYNISEYYEKSGIIRGKSSIGNKWFIENDSLCTNAGTYYEGVWTWFLDSPEKFSPSNRKNCMRALIQESSIYWVYKDWSGVASVVGIGSIVIGNPNKY